MIQNTTYECEICHKSYLTEDEASNCESGHKKPLDIRDKEYNINPYMRNGEYPTKLLVRMSDGVELWYRRQ